jgi:osmoprotectant transport system permease protein
VNFVAYIFKHTNEITMLIVQHITIFLISIVPAIFVGVALSIMATREGKEKQGNRVLTITAAAQSVPSVAVVAIVFIFVGVGALPAVIALFIYSLVPIVFNATSGMLSISPEVVEAAKGIGFTNKQVLWKVKIPLAVPVIMAGVRSAATINVGTATVASFIGGGGLGDLIFMGIKLYRSDMIFSGSLLVGLLAIVIDALLRLLEVKLVPRGLGDTVTV